MDARGRTADIPYRASIHWFARQDLNLYPPPASVVPPSDSNQAFALVGRTEASLVPARLIPESELF